MRRMIVLFLIAVFCAACTSQPPSTDGTVGGTAVPIRLLESWQAQDDTLTTGDAARAWRFNGAQGDALVLRVAAKDSGDVSLLLQDSSGTTLAEGDDLGITLPADGVYTALVRLVSGDAASYRLTLGYTDRDAPTATPSLTPTLTPTLTPSMTFTPSATFTASPTLTPTMTLTPVYTALGTLTGELTLGASVDGTFLSEFERHIYLFSGAANEQVTLTMVGTSGTVDPVVTLFDPTGQAIATDDNSGGDRSALLRDIRLPAAGAYVVQALGGGTGGYRISLQAEAPALSDNQPTSTPTAPLGTTTPVAAAEQLADHVLALGLIERAGAFDRYFIEAQAGDILTVGVRPIAGSPLLPRVEVYTPGGELLFLTTLANGVALIPSLPIAEAGKYAIYVNDAGRSGGAYTIAYGQGITVTDNLRGRLEADTPTNGGGVLMERDLWTLALATGDEIVIEAPGAALTVTAPDGQSISGGLNRVQFSAPMSGEYRVYASGGAYAITWRYESVAPTPAAPVLILSADDALPGQSYLTYPFQGGAGRRVHIRVEALNAGVDPVAELIDAAGATVASGDDSANSLNPDFGALLPDDGTYRLRINDYSGTGGVVNVTIEMLS